MERELAAPTSHSRPDQAVKQLRPQPAVLGLSEIDAARERAWVDAFNDYVFLESPPLATRKNRVLLGVHELLWLRPVERFRNVRPQTVRSALIEVSGSEIEIHAAHVPNGQSNGWVKIDDLLALRCGLELPHPRPQVLAGDFNTPRSESATGIITFGQTRSGRWRRRSKSRLFNERPWDARLWDAGERALLEELPRDCGMPDLFRLCHPMDFDALTWKPRGSATVGRRLDHVFASRELLPVACEHRDDWREDDLSDHSAVDVVFELDARIPG